MIKVIKLLLPGILIVLAGCSGKKVPLDKERFTALLIDMHRTDATLAMARGGGGISELKNYTYYNTLFSKYGIDRAQFDSCMYYYSAQKTMFTKMYDVVIDSLNRQLTAVNLILSELKANDTINLFPQQDTVVFDTGQIVLVQEIDSILPGLYKFSTTIQFDVPDKGKENRITAFFVSPDNKDTLSVRKTVVHTDTLKRQYNWSQYADSAYNRLVIKFVDADNVDKLKKREGKAWKTELFRTYVDGENKRRLKEGVAFQRREKERKKLESGK